METIQSTQICADIDSFLNDNSLLCDTESATEKLSNIFNKAGTIIGAIRPKITHNKSEKKKPRFDRDCSALKRSIHDLATRISNMQTNNELIKQL